jgi:hypothetical protein
MTCESNKAQPATVLAEIPACAALARPTRKPYAARQHSTATCAQHSSSQTSHPPCVALACPTAPPGSRTLHAACEQSWTATAARSQKPAVTEDSNTRSAISKTATMQQLHAHKAGQRVRPEVKHLWAAKHRQDAVRAVLDYAATRDMLARKAGQRLQPEVKHLQVCSKREGGATGSVNRREERCSSRQH